jgi:STE24 endopeptidase
VDVSVRTALIRLAVQRFFLAVILTAGCGSLIICRASNEGPSSAQEASPRTVKDERPVEVPIPGERAMSRYRSGNVLWVVNVGWGLLVPALFLFTGFSARIRGWATKAGKKWFLVVAIYFIIFTIINFVVDLPLAYYEGFVRQHAYGLSNQTFGKWFGDVLKSLAISLVSGALLLWVPYLLLRKSPRRWWLYTGILAVPFLFFVVLITPVWIDPLFNDFGPMRDKALEARILELAHRAGIEGSRVYEVNKSVDTKTLNAYVTGFLNTKRIVLWDTTISRLEEDELLFVMGHEMGHYVLGHVIQGILFASLLILVSLYLAHLLADLMLKRFGARFGFDKLSDIASLPLILLLISLLSLVVGPVGLAFSRHVEHEADRFGLEITKDNHAAATSFVKMVTDDLANPRPGPLFKLLRSSHPSDGERIDFCNTYRPWERGEPLKYGNLFQAP